jgi:hypothetical protein
MIALEPGNLGGLLPAGFQQIKGNAALDDGLYTPSHFRYTPAAFPAGPRNVGTGGLSS